MPNLIGQQLMGPPQEFVGPPSPQVGAQLQGPPQPGPAQTAGAPQGFHPIQAILQRARTDPNFARALQVAGLNLLNSGRDESTVRSFARAAQSGLSTYEQSKAAGTATARAASDETYKRSMEKRKQDAQDKADAIAAESARRTFIGQEDARKRAAEAAKRDDIYRARSLEIQGAAKTNPNQEVSIEQQMAMRAVANLYKREGVPIPPVEDLFIAGQELLSGNKRAAEGNTGGIPITAALQASANTAATGATPEEIAQGAKNLQSQFPETQALTPVQRIMQRIQEAKRNQPTNTNTGLEASNAPQAFNPSGPVEPGLQLGAFDRASSVQAPIPTDLNKIQLPQGLNGTTAKVVRRTADGMYEVAVITPNGGKVLIYPESWIRQNASWSK